MAQTHIIDSQFEYIVYIVDMMFVRIEDELHCMRTLYVVVLRHFDVVIFVLGHHHGGCHHALTR